MFHFYPDQLYLIYIYSHFIVQHYFLGNNFDVERCCSTLYVYDKNFATLSMLLLGRDIVLTL